MKTVSGKLSEAISNLGWDCYDNVVVEIGGTQVSGIHQGEDYNKKWQHHMEHVNITRMHS